MWPRAILHVLLGTLAIVNAAPRLLELRDAGNQPVCVPISPILHDVADLAAKIRPENGICKANQIFSSSDISRASLAALADDPYACSKDKPCGNGACCGKTGNCGYGEDYCGTNGESPNDVCWSNCDAHAECGRHADPPGKTCPLNVCCSQYGFCGTTSEFCDKAEGNDDDEDDETGCQSNCDQPSSGASHGDVQKRVIGYYEVWNHNKGCINMGIDDIPVESITHLYYSFGYIKPKTLEIVPMDDGGDTEAVSEFTFSAIAGLKKKNPDLKVVCALGGWTFNDNHTIWQPVFSEMVSTRNNRTLFTLMATQFLNRYGFDGLDFDWEYPGAGDRGGHPDDGVNFTELLKFLRKFLQRREDFELSFTAPTSYWYLRHFDLKATSEVVDYVNVMAYDLHGIWDSENPIGSQVLAHTNLTEIDHALDLLWRNDVDPKKVNLGIGFYGRTYQLADPGCSTPGCLFKGGGTPGPCTDQSGILSYAEIMDIKDKYELNPVYDEKHGVKYLTWNEDQWASYDDLDTIQQKIEFANSKGLGGLLIWALDLDTPNLDALSAVIWPETLGFRAKGEGADNWEDIAEGFCYSTDCGVNHCKTGYVKLQDFSCGDNDFPFNRPDGTQSLCCPIASAPDIDECTWRGGGDFCNGRCEESEVAVASSKWGTEGAYCLDGRKFLCCPSQVQQPICRWTECGEDCETSENELTWRDGVCFSDEQEKLCCNKEQDWGNCEWHGKPGSCFDNHCDTGWQVSITTSYDGEGEACNFFGRRMSFCCDLPGNTSPFLPVSLDYLFPDPPDEDFVNTDFELKVDPTWGGSEPDENLLLDEDPDEAPFGFIVMTSPPAIQQSLDRRDGSHWDVFDCLDATTIGEHTVRMACTNMGEDSNCDNIHLGHGASGTIVQMPKGCGPGKYAVVKHLHPSTNQTTPGHLLRRGIPHDTIYELTFDYDFKRVPRDQGDTQMRIDYSNDLDYWDGVVDRAANTKKKRKRDLVNKNHRRWLEEEWRDDAHFGGLSHEEFHKRWFGSDVIDWLKSLIGTVEKTVEFGHSYSEDFILKLVDETITCPNYEAHLDIHAESHVKAELSYGFTIIAKLGAPLDFSNSYLYFRTRGEVTAAFVVDAAITYHFETEDITIFAADKFGAAFTVPGIVTIGPNFEVFGKLEGAVTLGVNFETRVKLGGWDIQQTYPIPNDDYDPDLERQAKQELTPPQEPEVEWSVGVDGFITAHIKPTISFGIQWDDFLFDIDDCAVRLVTDGYVTFHAEAETGSSGTSACYGVDVGASIYADIQAPDAMKWALPRTPYYIVPGVERQVWPRSDGPMCWSPDSSKTARATIDAPGNISSHRARNYIEVADDGKAHGHQLGKRAKVYGPMLPIMQGLSCPGEDDGDEITACPSCGDGVSLEKRQSDGDSCPYDSDVNTGDEVCDFSGRSAERESGLVERAITEKWLAWDWAGDELILVVKYPTCSSAVQISQVDKYYGFDNSNCNPEISKLTGPNNQDYVSEHIYEGQTLKGFMEFLTGKGIALPTGYQAATKQWVSEVLMGVRVAGFRAPGWNGDLWEKMCQSIGSQAVPELLVLAESVMNGKKGIFFQGDQPKTLSGTLDETRAAHRKTAGVFSYMRDTNVWSKFKTSSQGIQLALNQFDDSYWQTTAGNPHPGAIQFPNRQTAGLEELYCYWIDMELANIEAHAGAWHTAATAAFRQAYGNTGPAKAWLDSLASGSMQKANLKFPKAGGRAHGRTGTWQRSNFDGLWTGPLGPF